MSAFPFKIFFYFPPRTPKCIYTTNYYNKEKFPVCTSKLHLGLRLMMSLNLIKRMTHTTVDNKIVYLRWTVCYPMCRHFGVYCKWIYIPFLSSQIIRSSYKILFCLFFVNQLNCAIVLHCSWMCNQSWFFIAIDQWNVFNFLHFYC